MDSEDEHSTFLPIKGIFQTKGRRTSELIPYLLINLRAFQCKSEEICEIVRFSVRESDEDPQLIARVSVAGCEPLIDSAVTYPECHIRRYEGSSMREYASVTGYCRQIASDLLRQEAELLKLAVEYDASYRALLQLAGNFDLFLGQWRWTVLGSLRDAISIFGQLNRIPCFLSACDESPPPTEPSGSAPSS